MALTKLWLNAAVVSAMRLGAPVVPLVSISIIVPGASSRAAFPDR